MKLIFPVHPRTRANLDKLGLSGKVEKMKNLIFTEPLGYLEFLSLMSHAAVVITDSGGIQEKTTILGVPCMTLRENTERPVTVTEGTNRLVKLTREDILRHYKEIRAVGYRGKGRVPKFWDGGAAGRIVTVIAERHGNGMI